MDEASLVLPVNVTSRSDVSRLLREIEAIENFLRQATTRTPGTPVHMPKSSRLLDEIQAANHLNLLQDKDRHRVTGFLQTVKAKGPVLHMSFSADPPPHFMQKIVAYLRQEIHPLVLVSTGLQPTIGAGCILRTTNRYFDFSLRQRFADKRDILIERLNVPETTDLKVQLPEETPA